MNERKLELVDDYLALYKRLLQVLGISDGQTYALKTEILRHYGHNVINRIQQIETDTIPPAVTVVTDPNAPKLRSWRHTANALPQYPAGLGEPLQQVASTSHQLLSPPVESSQVKKVAAAGKPGSLALTDDDIAEIQTMTARAIPKKYSADQLSAYLHKIGAEIPEGASPTQLAATLLSHLQKPAE